nr:YopT-type cysteine protease domain-containing protein [Pseudomonas sp. TH21]
MQNQVGARSAFHAGQPVRELSVNDMVKELADATVSKSVMIDSPGHAMAAGVKIQDGSRSYYFYDPNFGLADFSSAEAMQKGLEKLTRDKKLKPQYKTHDTDPNKLTFKVFDHDDAWQQKNSVFSADVKKLYENPLALSGTTPLSNAELRKNWEILYQAPDNQQRICYESSVLIGQSEKTLSPEVFTAVIASTNGEGTNYSRRYLDLMGIKQDSLKATFNAEDITESGLINFKHTNQGGEFGHTVYIQKTKNDELFLFNINSPDLDVAMIRNGNPPEYSGGMSVFPLSNGKSKGLQDFLDGLGGKPGWQFAYTPASTLNANVKKLAP